MMMGRAFQGPRPAKRGRARHTGEAGWVHAIDSIEVIR